MSALTHISQAVASAGTVGESPPPFGKVLRVLVNGVEIWQIPLRPGYERYFETTRVPIYAGRQQVGEDVVEIARYRKVAAWTNWILSCERCLRNSTTR